MITSNAGASVTSPVASSYTTLKFFQCQLAPLAKAIVADVRDAVAKVAHELNTMASLDSTAGETADRMRVAWRDGVASLAPRPT